MARVTAAAAEWVAGVVAEIPADGWDGPGLGEWDLRGLVGHTSRALLTVRAALETVDRVREADALPELAHTSDYFLEVARLPGADPENVRERGVEAGRALGDDPAAAFARLADSVLAEVRGAGNPVVESIAGTIRLSDYLGSRVFELVVHGIDICGALGREADVPEQAASEALQLAAVLAARGGHGVDLLLAATGRRALPAGFSVLQPRAGSGIGGGA